MRLSELPLAGLHNAANALAALGLCRAFGLDYEPLVSSLRNFRGLPHRVELVDTIDGVRYYDDSKGTNVGATIAALRGLGGRLGKSVLIAGGEGKGQDFTPLASAVKSRARAVVVIGRDGPRIEAALAGVEQLPAAPPTIPVELDVEEIDFDAPPSWAAAYAPSQAKRRWISAELGEVEARPALQEFIKKVLADEAPLHRDLLYRRVREAFGVGRVGARIKDNVEFVARRITIDGAPVKIDSSGFFRGAPLSEVRVPISDDDIRTIGQTPPEEIDLAVANLVRDAVTISDDDVIAAIRVLFGWRRAGGDIQVGITTAIDRCLKEGTVIRTGNGTLKRPD